MNTHLLIIIALVLVVAFGIYFTLKIIYVTCIVLLVLVLAHYLYRRFWINRENFEMTFHFINDAANVAARPEIYCGTDLLVPDDYDLMGTRHACLKKGIGIGMGMSDNEINNALARAANRPPPDPNARTYCGNDDAVPPGYIGFATPNECLRKGVGVGMREPVNRRQMFRNQARQPLGKKELSMLSRRFGLNPDNITRQQARAQLVNLM